jgi:hypothetical protein
MIPPIFMTIAIKSSENKGLRLWLPLIVVWPILIVLYIVLLPLAAVAELALQERGIRPFSILIALVQTLSALRGMVVNVVSDRSKKRTFVKIRIV